MIGAIRGMAMHRMFPGILNEISDEEVNYFLFVLLNDSLSSKSKFMRWRARHILDYFLYEQWYKTNVSDSKKDGIDKIKIVWEIIFENYLEGNNFLKEFVLNFRELEEEEIEDELEELFLNPYGYADENYDIHLKYLFLMKECTENILKTNELNEENKILEYLKKCVNEEILKENKIEENEKNLRLQKIIEKLTNSNKDDALFENHKIRVKDMKKKINSAKGKIKLFSI
ncbi:unnamed protein product [Meloidogyne enterolobii]|uniref:Uncharacterized protein n=1 Tax=Meloidogyne enterolobii TaxID=390850 RepID=A0ACB0YIV6_MELEN